MTEQTPSYWRVVDVDRAGTYLDFDPAAEAFETADYAIDVLRGAGWVRLTTWNAKGAHSTWRGLDGDLCAIVPVFD